MTTYNVPDCTCDEDHDSLEHIIKAVLYSPGVEMIPIEDVAEAISKAAQVVGWRKVNLDAEDLASFLSGDPSEELKSVVAESKRSETEKKADDGD